MAVLNTSSPVATGTGGARPPRPRRRLPSAVTSSAAARSPSPVRPARHRCAVASITTGSPRRTVWRTAPGEACGRRRACCGCGWPAAPGPPPWSRRGRRRTGWPPRPASTGPPCALCPARRRSVPQPGDGGRLRAHQREAPLGAEVRREHLPGDRQRRLQPEHARAGPGRRGRPWPRARAGRGRWRWRRWSRRHRPATTAATSLVGAQRRVDLEDRVVARAQRRG